MGKISESTVPIGPYVNPIIARPVHKNRNTTMVLPDSSIVENTKPNNAERIHTAMDVVLRPNFSAKMAESGINAAKQNVASNCSFKNSARV